MTDIASAAPPAGAPYPLGGILGGLLPIIMAIIVVGSIVGMIFHLIQRKKSSGIKINILVAMLGALIGLIADIFATRYGGMSYGIGMPDIIQYCSIGAIIFIIFYIIFFRKTVGTEKD